MQNERINVKEIISSVGREGERSELDIKSSAGYRLCVRVSFCCFAIVLLCITPSHTIIASVCCCCFSIRALASHAFETENYITENKEEEEEAEEKCKCFYFSTYRVCSVSTLFLKRQRQQQQWWWRYVEYLSFECFISMLLERFVNPEMRTQYRMVQCVCVAKKFHFCMVAHFCHLVFLSLNPFCP